MLEVLLKRIQEMQGMKDSRGLQGILSRGKNVYNASSNAAQSGGGVQYGRPTILRRIQNGRPKSSS